MKKKIESKVFDFVEFKSLLFRFKLNYFSEKTDQIKEHAYFVLLIL